MSQKYFLVEYVGEINKTIKQTLQQTQRIKFTSFDVSVNFIAFGATSGGIYIFKREPCDFIKLVPSKEGAVSHIAISPDEKVIAITSSRGLVVFIENCFTDTNVRYQIFREHEGHVVTTVKWHFNDFYCGDNFGKVSVITLTSILSKAIFHTPSAILMHLGSPIVQLDTHLKFLLVSTKAKTFLCDTEEELYRQIGKKIRDGEYGGCFYTDRPTHKVKVREKEKTVFKILKEDEKFTALDVEGAKIFCSRPGLRIWEANFDASVMCTYQFKNTVNQNNTEIIQLNTDPSARLTTNKAVIKDPLNFGRIFIAGQFILTFAGSHVFIFDTTGVNLLFICNPFNNIKDVKILNNYIYIWNKKDMKVLELMDLEMLLLKAITRKQYLLCLDLCLKYNEEVVELLKSSAKLHPLVILRDKLDGDEKESILPILNKIKDIKHGSNGIKRVENGHAIAGCSYDYSSQETFIEKTNEANGAQESNSEIEDDINVDPILDPNYALNILYRQYQVSKMYSNIETPQFYEVLSSKNLNEIVTLFKDFMKYVEDMDVGDNNLDNWCYNQYLKYVERVSSIKNLDLDSMALNYIFEAFKSINSNSCSCKCTFPLPPIGNIKTEYYDVGCELCKKLSRNDLKKFCHTTPVMWKFYLTEYKHEIQASLALLVQFSDLNLLGSLSKKFNYDVWEDAIRLLIKLKRNICLNCEKRVDFDAASTISWKDFGLAVVRSIGGTATVKLLQRYARFIPNSQLGVEFYQSCIFSGILNERERSFGFMENIYKEKHLSDKFDNNLQKYLSNKRNGVVDTKDLTKSNIKCSMCDLPLKTPILEDGGSLSCGHPFHRICLDSIQNLCSLCDVKLK